MSGYPSDNPEQIDLIWHQVTKGEVTAFRSLFDLYYERLVAFSHRFTQQQTVSEEITQDVFISIWERRNEIKLESSIKSYLYRSVRNRTINYLKNQLPKEQKTTDIEYADQLIAIEDAGIDIDELKLLIDSAIETLPGKCRTIFLLSRNEGLTHKEIASELEISVKTVENQIGNALKKLREKLSPHISTLLIFFIFEIVFCKL